MEFIYEKNRIYVKNEKNEKEILAEVTFPNIDENIVEINHTFVDETLRGKGVANQLLEKLTEYMLENNLKCIPTCTYAISWFEKNPEKKNLISKDIK